MTNRGTRDMTVGSPRRHILAFALPILLSNLFQQLYNTADAIIVGNFIGKDALAAVSSSGSLIFLFTSFFMGIAMGAGVVVSRYFGAKDYDKMRRAIHTTIAFGACAGLLMTVAGILFTPQVLVWMGTDPGVLPSSIIYFRCYFSGSVFMVLYSVFMGTMNAVGDSRRPLLYLVISSCLNVALDLLLVGVCNLGVGAAAVATAISQAVSAALCLFYLVRPGTVFRVELRRIRFHRDVFAEIVRYGLPTGVQNSVIGFANVIVQSNINRFGEDAMAGCGSYMKIEGFAFLPITCFAMALATFVSQNLGAGQQDRAKSGARFGIVTSVVMAEVIGAAVFFAAPYLVALFNRDPVVVAFGVQQARIEALFYCLLAFSHCIAGICRGAGRAVVPMCIMLAVWCVFRIIYITVALKICLDIRLVFMAYPITWSISSVIYFIYYKKSNWVNGYADRRQKEKKQVPAS